MFKQGQYLTLKLIINGEELRRSYSICSSPMDNELRVAIKKVKDGRVSSFINDKCKVGDMIEVMNPMGNFFTEMNPANKKTYVLFAGGSGITPMMSIMKTVLKSEPQSRITLLYGNNDHDSIIFKKQIEMLAIEHEDKLNVVHLLNTPPAGHPVLLQGLMTMEKVVKLIDNYVELNNDNEFFICGPAAMMDNVMATLKDFKLKEEKIHIEYFSAPAAAADSKAEATNASGVTATILLDGDEHKVVM